MATWGLEFYPAEGQRHSPVDALKKITSPLDTARIVAKLQSLQELDQVQWTHMGIKQVKGLAQMRQGDFRVYFKLIDGTIVVFHACRKVTQKAKDTDLAIAVSNYEDYLNEVGND